MPPRVLYNFQKHHREVNVIREIPFNPRFIKNSSFVNKKRRNFSFGAFCLFFLITLYSQRKVFGRILLPLHKRARLPLCRIRNRIRQALQYIRNFRTCTIFQLDKGKICRKRYGCLLQLFRRAPRIPFLSLFQTEADSKPKPAQVGRLPKT